VDGTQTAVVVGPSGEEIFCDKYGRVKVQFNWDRQGKKNADSSCWVRVSQAWAGKGFGALHIPRVGQEVVVDFLEGDPDRPLIVGTVYNAEQMPPHQLPDKKTYSGLKTRSQGGTASNANELRFQDTLGSELLHLQAEKNMSHRVENSYYLKVGGSAGSGSGGGSGDPSPAPDSTSSSRRHLPGPSARRMASRSSPARSTWARSWKSWRRPGRNSRRA
jgi:type VI secretion system secreted protein VgrG